MPSRRHVARDISYSYSAETKGGRMVIRLMENTTGRLRLIKRADGYEKDVANGRDFWAVMVERYGLSLDVVGGALSNIPSDGPLILIANHPYGILDGLMMGPYPGPGPRRFPHSGTSCVSQGRRPGPDHPAHFL